MADWPVGYEQGRSEKDFGPEIAPEKPRSFILYGLVWTGVEQESLTSWMPTD